MYCCKSEERAEGGKNVAEEVAVAAVRRRVRLEGGDEAEEMYIEGGEMEVETREGKGPLREGQGWSYADYLRFDQGRE